ncbi:hypothetical protein [Iamia sp.]|uniref:hypothetical protein n=1 Tax=Iamia sp. TaxID=2722710 RepID=UPI002CCD4CFD|nr:hypothetical protein [Iamia sp.]HXH56273.1 hypothetical protein [Iamia sp.]
MWVKARDLDFAVTFHGGLGNMATGSFTSVSNYSFNHVGSFAQRMHTLVKSLFMGGVTRRFPDMGFAVLECGVGSFAHLSQRPHRPLGEASPRGPRTARPGRHRLGRAGGADAPPRPRAARRRDDVRAGLATIPGIGVPPAERDEWRHVGASSPDELIDRFAPSFYFGCEADDRTVAYAFSPANSRGFGLKPLFSSDIGHWDAGDVAGVVAEAYELVEHQILTEAQFSQFVYENPARLFLDQNPDFFARTAVAAHLPAPADA